MHIKSLRTTLLLLLLPFVARAQYQLYLTPYTPLAKAVTGHYAGIIQDRLEIWGGYSIRTNPILLTPEDVYEPNAFGATVDMEGQFFCIGGRYTRRVSPYCLLMKERPSGGRGNQWRIDESGREERPLLPFGLMRHTAILRGEGYERSIYVVGGQRDSIYNNKVLRMGWPRVDKWSEVCEMPGEARISPCVVGSHGGFIVIGGCQWDMDSLLYSTQQKSGLRFDEQDNTWESLSWEDVPDSDFPAAACASAPMSKYCTLFVGGKERDGSYREHLVIYNRLTNRWCSFPGDAQLARSDAQLTRFHDGYLLSGGEVAPKEFTREVTFLQFHPTTKSTWTLVAFNVLNYALLLLITLYIGWGRKRWRCALMFGASSLLAVAAKYGLMYGFFCTHPHEFPFYSTGLMDAVEHYPILSGAWYALLFVPALAYAALVRQVWIALRKKA